jgi:membrane-bound lytic murein transglycosylase D
MTALAGWYLSAAALLAVGGLVLALLVRRPGLGGQAERGLRLGWALLALALALPVAARLGAAGRTGAAPLEIWNGPRLDGGGARAPRLTLVGRPAPAPLQGGPILVVLVAGGVLASGARILAQRRGLSRLLAALPVVKAVGRVRLCASDETGAPFAARARGLAYIVVPTALLADLDRLRLVIAHEAQHHRGGDLPAAMALAALRALFFWNPALALWERTLGELQDLACDGRVLVRRRVEPLEYSRCLLWAAEAAQQPRYRLAQTRAMAAGPAASLRRRILMLNDRPRPLRLVPVGLLCAVLLAGTAWAVEATVADHRLSPQKVRTLAERIEKRSGFPMLVDDRVVDRLNSRVATPEGRERTRQALARMPRYRATIEEGLRARGLPVELLGMVLSESGFDNDARPNRPPERQSAGIWQIIPGTARRLGLQVGPAADERLDPRKATDAAAAFVAELHQRYGDWVVAITAYNAGHKLIDDLIASGPPSEARSRVLAGNAEYANYLRSVMASIIIIDNPDLLN